jgi:hypothetical protein
VLKKRIKHGLHALRAFILVLWWMAVAFAGVSVAYIMLKS